MLIKKEILKRIKAGEVSLAFRKWKHPTVKSGGTLRTAVGVLAIDDLEPINPGEITKVDAKQAGYATKAFLIDKLNRRDSGTIYRIKLHYKGRDPRKILQEDDDLTEKELTEIAQELEGLDRRSHSDAWTHSVLRGIDEYPGMKAADLSEKLNVKKGWLKRNVRKLKELGLTISLLPGYRLSPRGKVVLSFLEKQG